VQAAFTEPRAAGVLLTEEQAQRLWQLERDACRILLNVLVDSGFLRRTPRGGYVRGDRRA